MKSLALFFFLFAAIVIAGCSQNNDHHDDAMEEHMDDRDMTTTGRTALDSSVIRDKNIDVASLDKNGDGKVFQCPMDYEVISDEFGNCPLCNMKLKEYSVKEAEKNLREG